MVHKIVNNHTEALAIMNKARRSTQVELFWSENGCAWVLEKIPGQTSAQARILLADGRWFDGRITVREKLGLSKQQSSLN